MVLPEHPKDHKPQRLAGLTRRDPETGHYYNNMAQF